MERRQVVPVYIAFLLVMVPFGALAARLARLDAPASRAVVFSVATRNSLMVLPLALALAELLAIAALVVVTQTLIELVGMVGYIWLVPRIWPARAKPSSGTQSVVARRSRRSGSGSQHRDAAGDGEHP